MNGERENIGIVTKYERCAVTLVKVHVDDQDFVRQTFLLQATYGDSDIVEYAEAPPAIRKGMMIATAKVSRHAVLKSQAGSHESAAAFESDIIEQVVKRMRCLSGIIFFRLQFKD